MIPICARMMRSVGGTGLSHKERKLGIEAPFLFRL